MYNITKNINCLCTYLSSLFNFLLLSISFLHVPHEQTLTQEFFGTARGLNVQQCVVGIFNHALTKSADSKLDHGSVIQDLQKKKKKLFRSCAVHIHM